MNETSDTMTLLVVVTDYYDARGNPEGFEELRASATDEPIDEVCALDAAAHELGAEDGDEIEIIVRKTGRRPFGDRKMRRVRRHAYEREAEAAASSAISAPRDGGAS